MNEEVEHLGRDWLRIIWKEWACGLVWEEGRQRESGPVGLRTMLVASRRFRSHGRTKIISMISHTS
jgi:hypothetical protein